MSDYLPTCCQSADASGYSDAAVGEGYTCVYSAHSLGGVELLSALPLPISKSSEKYLSYSSKSSASPSTTSWNSYTLAVPGGHAAADVHSLLPPLSLMMLAVRHLTVVHSHSHLQNAFSRVHITNICSTAQRTRCRWMISSRQRLGCNQVR